jgi:ribonuclease BN (tRNA processing enzyme)
MFPQSLMRCDTALLLAAAFVLSPLSALCQSELTPSSTTQVVLLGTGTPGPLPEKSGPSTAIVVNGTPYLVDLGPGVVRRATAAYRKGREAKLWNEGQGLHFSALKVAFITHLHSDHTVGYPDFIFTPWVVGRAGPVEVYGPKGIKAMTEHIMAAWKEDIRIRTAGLERHFPEHNDTGYKMRVHEVSPGIVYQDKNVTVTAFHVQHGEWGPDAFGYRFQTPDRVIVISGDTSPSQSTIDACNACDILVHEVYTQKGFEARPPAWQQYMLQYHTSPQQVGELAAKAKPKLLVLTHQIYHLGASTEEDLLKEVTEVYTGRFVSGHDLDIF